MSVNWPNVVAENRQAVWRTICRIVDDPEAARDCYQETFLAALRLSRRQPIDNWLALLRAIAAQIAIDHLRLSKRRGRLRTDVGGIDDLPDRSSIDPDDLASRELIQKVRELLVDVAPRQAQAFWLRFVEQMDVNEVAQQLNTTPANVSVLVNRAAAQLREQLGRTAYAPEPRSKS